MLKGWLNIEGRRVGVSEREVGGSGELGPLISVTFDLAYYLGIRFLRYSKLAL